MPTVRPAKPLRLAALMATAAMALAACGEGSAAQTSSSPAAIAAVRIGFFPNLTHAPALVGLQEGLFKDALQPLKLTVTPTVFNAGPEAVTALFANSLDIAYVGPNPTINAYSQSKGEAVRVIAGAASGGAALVVRKSITSPAGLKGKKLATPQLGNTQDVALRHWLQSQGLRATVEGGGDVAIVPQPNAEGLAAFISGQIDGAWVPQPWVAEYGRAGARVLVDEASGWPLGRFVTTNVLVRTSFLTAHPEAVAAFLDAHIAALQEINEDPERAARAVNENLRALTGASLDPAILRAAFDDVEFTADPLAHTLKQSADNAVAVGLLDQAKIDAAGGLPGSLYDLGLLNEALQRAKLDPVQS